jgi:beta-N-acetylglucosaminidase
MIYSSIHSQSSAKYRTKLDIKTKTINNIFVISAKFIHSNDGKAQINNAKHKSQKANHHLFGIALIKAIKAIGIVILNKNIPIIPKTID